MSPLLPLPPAVTVGSAGSLVPGDQVQSLTGGWDGDPTAYTYQWQRSLDGVTSWSSVGVTTSAYRVTTADLGYRLSCLVVASNLAGAAPAARSEVVGPVGTSGTATPLPRWGAVRRQ